MAISDDDAGLAEALLERLHHYGAGWVAAEVEAEREVRGRPDPERDVEMLLIAISRSLGLVPELLVDATRRIREMPESPTGVILGESDLALDFDQILGNLARSDELLGSLVRSAAVLRAPVQHLLSERLEEE